MHNYFVSEHQNRLKRMKRKLKLAKEREAKRQNIESEKNEDENEKNKPIEITADCKTDSKQPQNSTASSSTNSTCAPQIIFVRFTILSKISKLPKIKIFNSSIFLLNTFSGDARAAFWTR